MTVRGRRWAHLVTAVAAAGCSLAWVAPWGVAAAMAAPMAAPRQPAGPNARAGVTSTTVRPAGTSTSAPGTRTPSTSTPSTSTPGTGTGSTSPRGTGAGPSGTTTTSTPGATKGITKGPDSLELLWQSPWVGPGPGHLRFRLHITASDARHETLAVLVYPALIARSQFQAAMGGTDQGVPVYDPGVVPLDQLTADPAGGVDVDISVGTPTGAPWPPTSTGVYPVQLFLEDSAGARVGQPLNTFLVHVGADAANFHRLDVSFVLPLATKVRLSSTGALGPVGPRAAAVLEADATTAAGFAVPLTFETNLPTLEALQAGSHREQEAVGSVQAAVVAGDEMLPATRLPLNPGSLETSGLTADLAQEVSAGQNALGSLLSTPPSIATWALNGRVSPSSVSALAGNGATRLVVPQAALADLPVGNQGLTFAQPTTLRVWGRQVQVLGADTELSTRVALASGPLAVLVANQELAELAMIDLEAPNHVRGVVVMPPASALVSPAFLSVLLNGLQHNPLLQAVTIEEMSAQVPLAESTSGQVTLTDNRPTPPLPGIYQLQAARAAVRDDAQVYGRKLALLGQLDGRLATSLSDWFTTGQREKIIAGVLSSARSELYKVRLPRAFSITLTAQHGTLPLTLVNGGPGPMRVRLVMTSEQLSFVPKRFPQGVCHELHPGSQACDLLLSHASTTLEIPVVVRTPGAFPLSLVVETPTGDRHLASSTDTVRVTALSDVGLVLMIGAALFLVFWWVRNARHGRRARKLVPRPLEGTAPDGPPGEPLAAR